MNQGLRIVAEPHGGLTNPKAENPRPRKNIRKVRIGKSTSSLSHTCQHRQELLHCQCTRHIPSTQDLDRDVVCRLYLVFVVGGLTACETCLFTRNSKTVMQAGKDVSG